MTKTNLVSVNCDSSEQFNSFINKKLVKIYYGDNVVFQNLGHHAYFFSDNNKTVIDIRRNKNSGFMFYNGKVTVHRSGANVTITGIWP